MRDHPELPLGSNELINFINGSNITLVMCHGCGVQRPINNEYAAYVLNGLRDCRFCRESDQSGICRESDQSGISS